MPNTTNDDEGKGEEAWPSCEQFHKCGIAMNAPDPWKKASRFHELVKSH